MKSLKQPRVHKQRTFYAKNDVNYMMTKAPKVRQFLKRKGTELLRIFITTLLVLLWFSWTKLASNGHQEAILGWSGRRGFRCWYVSFFISLLILSSAVHFSMPYQQSFHFSQLEFGKIHGHYDVPRPVVTSEGSGYNSPEYRLYKWVESLHSMYRSYKLGRQSGSLTDERVLLLVKHGFVFRND